MSGVCSITTERLDGDFALGCDASELDARRRAVVDVPWVWLRQVHGSTVHTVDADTVSAVCGREGDALVTRDPDLALAVQTADCVPVVLVSPEGPFGVAHAGWRGLEAGVLEATVASLHAIGARTIVARVGPCLRTGCYEFGADDLGRLESRFGPGIRGVTAAGSPALDLLAVVHRTLGRAGVVEAPIGSDGPPCTACEPQRYFSHRARAEPGRMATVAWRTTPRATGPST